jgi:hypothetical protein
MDEVNPHVILTDIVMPVMGGEKLIKTVKEKYPHMEVIVLSSFSEIRLRPVYFSEWCSGLYPESRSWKPIICYPSPLLLDSSFDNCCPNIVRAQTGKHISAEVAAYLIRDASALQ